jgi:hypothetical protein
MTPFVFGAPTPEESARFMSHVDQLPCGCWYWTGARSRGRGNFKWYGTFLYRGRRIRAHRFADDHLAGRGPLPPGYHRDHTCEFSMCVHPGHLERVTHAENQRRKVERRRRLRKVPPGTAQHFTSPPGGGTMAVRQPALGGG